MTDSFGRPIDLDKSGQGFHKSRSYLGPSLGWVETQILPERRINFGGQTVQINPGDQVILTEIGLPITFLLPDVKAWQAQNATQPATGWSRGLVFKDYGGNARDVHVTIVPFGQQTIDGLNQSIILSQDYEVIILHPLVDGTGWYASIQTFDTGTGGTTAINPTAPIIGNVTGDVMNVGMLFDTSKFAVVGGKLDFNVCDPGFVLGNPTIGTTNPSFTALTGILDRAIGSTQGQIMFRNNAQWTFLNPGQAGQALASGGSGGNPFWTFMGAGDVQRSGVPTAGQWARWTDGFHIEGVNTAATPWVLKTGDTMTGDLTISANNPALRLNSTGGSPDFIVMGHDGLVRWSIQTTGVESGSNSGSDLGIVRFNDAGAGIDQIVTVSRQTGLVTFGGDALVNDGDLEVRAMAVPPGGARLKLNKTQDIFASFVRGTLNGVNRWQLHLGNATPESGSNSGSDFMLQRHTDAGAVIDNALFFSRQTGLGTVAGNPTVPLGIATKQYVDGQVGIFAPINSPTFTGDPKAPTPATADNDTSIATTAFVKNQGYALLTSPVFTGDPQAPTPPTADNDTSIATTGFVKAQGYTTVAAVAAGFQPLDATLTAVAGLSTSADQVPYFTGTDTAGMFVATAFSRGLMAQTSAANWVTALGAQPLDGDLTALSALSGTNTIYYRSAADTWSPVAIGANLTFTGGTLAASGGGGGGGDVFKAGTAQVFTGDNYFTNLPLTLGSNTRIDTGVGLEINNTTTSRMSVVQWDTGAILTGINFRKSRGATPGTHVIVQNNDGAQFNFSGSDGSVFIGCSAISMSVDGTPGAGSMPGKMTFNTRPVGAGQSNTIRMTIASTGNVSMGASEAAANALFTANGCSLRGTVTNDNAAAGFVGEYPAIAPFNGITINAATVGTVATITLSAGDWDVWAAGMIQSPSGTSAIYSITTGTTTLPLVSGQTASAGIPASGNAAISLQTRISLSASTGVNLVCSSGTNSTVWTGALCARRVR